MSASLPVASSPGAVSSASGSSLSLGSSLPTSLLIRAATGSDQAAVQRLLSAAAVEQGLSVDATTLERTVALSLSKGSAAWLVLAFSSGMAVGVALGNPVVHLEHGAALRLEALHVTPGRRTPDAALERALVDFLAEEARCCGMTAILWEVAGDSAPASGTHAQSVGFEPHAAQAYRRLIG